MRLVRREGSLFAAGTWAGTLPRKAVLHTERPDFQRLGYDESVQIRIYGPKWASFEGKQSLRWDLWSVLLSLRE